MNRQDLSTMLWKERKGLFRVRGRRSQFILLLLGPLLVAVAFPIQMGKDWLASGLNLIVAFLVPMIIVGTSIPDSFAGERERKTLSTLLASRLPDMAIFFGKLLTSVLFGWGMCLIFIILSTIAVNIAAWDGRFLFYTPATLFGNVVISLLVALMVAGAGVLFSLRAETVQQAQQSLMVVMLVPPMIFQALVFVALGSQAGREKLRELTQTVPLESFVLVVVVLLTVLAASLIVVAVRRFQREKLITS